MGCGGSSLAATRISINVCDDQYGNLPTGAVWIPGNKKNVPEQLRACITFAEWLEIITQLEHTMLSQKGHSGAAPGCPDPLKPPGETMVAALNATFAESRGVKFSLTSFMDTLGGGDTPVSYRFYRTFIIDIVGECCILTREHQIDVPIPAGTKPGKKFSAQVLDGQVFTFTCPKNAAAGSTTSITMAAPVLGEQTLRVTVPEGAAGGQTIPVHLPGGGTAPVQLPADAAPGTVVQMQMRCVQLRPMKEEEIEVVVPSTVKYNRAFRVALPGGGTKVVTAPAGVKAGAAMKVTVKVPVE